MEVGERVPELTASPVLPQPPPLPGGFRSGKEREVWEVRGESGSEDGVRGGDRVGGRLKEPAGGGEVRP